MTLQWFGLANIHYPANAAQSNQIAKCFARKLVSRHLRLYAGSTEAKQHNLRQFEESRASRSAAINKANISSAPVASSAESCWPSPLPLGRETRMYFPLQEFLMLSQFFQVFVLLQHISNISGKLSKHWLPLLVVENWRIHRKIFESFRRIRLPCCTYTTLTMIRIGTYPDSASTRKMFLIISPVNLCGHFTGLKMRKLRETDFPLKLFAIWFDFIALVQTYCWNEVVLI